MEVPTISIDFDSMAPADRLIFLLYNLAPKGIGPVSKALWTKALPFVQRFASAQLEPTTEKSKWIARFQNLAKVAVCKPLDLYDPYRQFMLELVQIAIDENYEAAPSSNLTGSYLSLHIHYFSGFKDNELMVPAPQPLILNTADVMATTKIITRKQLYHAASLIHKIFVTFREHTFESSLIQVEGRKGILYFTIEDRGHDANKGEFLFKGLDKVLVKERSHQLAIMMFAECQSALATMDEQIRSFLSVLCSKIEEVHVKVKNAFRPTCRIDTNHIHKNNMENRHTILRVTTFGGEMFAVDLTGAQYGWKEVVVPWTSFYNHRVHTIRDIQAQGSQAIEALEVGEESNLSGMYCQSQLMVAKALNLHVAIWLGKNDLTITQFVDLAADDFKRKEKELNAGVNTGMSGTIDFLRKKGVYRWYFENPFLPMRTNLTRSQEEYKERKEFWANDDEYAKVYTVKRSVVKRW
ncbi:hypothetical protein EJ08DRAFT_683410 [Tothia fuscella]|uniref:Uncharacterized protein n=1 Tax=Tothia fuscella TaxID=1048955 RepID=A0A9P4NG36_9PEZI|nr:hypothetical protein EJ08DRAFT_683410 [Tothia fuscella]